MTRHDSARPVRIEVLPATPDEQSILANLLELYAHDFSDFLDLELGPDGRYDYKDLLLYWCEPGRHPFLVRVDGQLAGLALVKSGSPLRGAEAAWDLAEFFVVGRYRRRGIGTAVAHQLWRRFPGLWQVRVMELNVRAHRFWECAILEFVGEAVHPVRIETGGKSWRIFQFESKRAADQKSRETT